MGVVDSQFSTTTQFYLYGRQRFTQTGWKAASAAYPQPDVLLSLELTGKTYLVTGANQGIGFEVSKYLASRGGRVFMVCRNAERAEAARKTILEHIAGLSLASGASAAPGAPEGATQVQCLICDCGVESQVRGMWAEFSQLADRLDGLVCNAGALFNEKTLTSQGVESTFALHLLYGTYLMTKLALEHLGRSDDPRVVLVSSGGMLNTAWPSWQVGSGQITDKYDGQFAYAFAKRAQVLLAERWTREHFTAGIKFVSAHPGWTKTAAVDAAYGENQSYLEPMRTTWEGAEGIAWLAAAPGEHIESGEFYLDRSPQYKHLAGPFFTEGTYTKNSEAQVDLLVANLDAWANGRWDELPMLPAAAGDAAELGAERESREESAELQPLSGEMDLNRFMGRWYVVACVPTMLDKGASNAVEEYTWDAANECVMVNFTYTKEGGGASSLEQKATVSNAPANTVWAISPKVFGLTVPLRLGYIVMDLDSSDSVTQVGTPDRSYVWLMARELPMSHAVYTKMLRRAEAEGFNLSLLEKVAHDGVPSSVAAPISAGGGAAAAA